MRDYEDYDYMDKEEFEEDYDLDIINSLKDVCDYIREDEDSVVYTSEVIDHLSMVREDLEFMEEFYNEPPPSGGAGARDIMLDIISRLRNSMEEIDGYLEDGERGHILKSLEILNNADAIVEDLRAAINQHRMELAEMMSRIERGELTEGEPLAGGKKEDLRLTGKALQMFRKKSGKLKSTPLKMLPGNIMSRGAGPTPPSE